MPPAPSVSVPWRVALSATKPIRNLLSPHWHAVRAATRAFPDQLFQPAADTWHDRHPRLFAFVARQLETIERPRVLSFGCSTGEEAFTLASYLPGAAIDAVDINARSIGRARRVARRHRSAAIHLACRGDPPAEPERFDAIFCLSVFRHGRLDRERPDRCSAIIPFSRFEEAIGGLDATLKTGGLLCLWAANFRFADTIVAGRYRPVIVPGMPVQHDALYGRDDRRLADEGACHFVFRKLASTPTRYPVKRSG